MHFPPSHALSPFSTGTPPALAHSMLVSAAPALTRSAEAMLAAETTQTASLRLQLLRMRQHFLQHQLLYRPTTLAAAARSPPPLDPSSFMTSPPPIGLSSTTFPSTPSSTSPSSTRAPSPAAAPTPTPTVTLTGALKSERGVALVDGHQSTRRKKRQYKYPCKVEGCKSTAKGGGACIKHGGGKRCALVGCDKVARFAGSRCHIHRDAKPPSCASEPSLASIRASPPTSSSQSLASPSLSRPLQPSLLSSSISSPLSRAKLGVATATATAAAPNTCSVANSVAATAGMVVPIQRNGMGKRPASEAFRFIEPYLNKSNHDGDGTDNNIQIQQEAAKRRLAVWSLLQQQSMLARWQ